MSRRMVVLKPSLLPREQPAARPSVLLDVWDVVQWGVLALLVVCIARKVSL